jgi:hypothetical protein
VAIRSLKLAKDYRLGWPLPNQLPKPPAAQLQAINLFLSTFSRKFIPDFIPDWEAGSTVLLTRSPLPFGRSTRMCQARFQRSFGARITPKRFSEQNLDSIFFLILVLVEHDCSPLEEFLLIELGGKMLDSNLHLLRRRIIRNKLKTDNKRKR